MLKIRSLKKSWEFVRILEELLIILQDFFKNFQGGEIDNCPVFPPVNYMSCWLIKWSDYSYIIIIIITIIIVIIITIIIITVIITIIIITVLITIIIIIITIIIIVIIITIIIITVIITIIIITVLITIIIIIITIIIIVIIITIMIVIIITIIIITLIITIIITLLWWKLVSQICSLVHLHIRSNSSNKLWSCLLTLSGYQLTSRSTSSKKSVSWSESSLLIAGPAPSSPWSTSSKRVWAEAAKHKQRKHQFLWIPINQFGKIGTVYQYFMHYHVLSRSLAHYHLIPYIIHVVSCNLMNCDSWSSNFYRTREEEAKLSPEQLSCGDWEQQSKWHQLFNNILLNFDLYLTDDGVNFEPGKNNKQRVMNNYNAPLVQ